MALPATNDSAVDDCRQWGMAASEPENTLLINIISAVRYIKKKKKKDSFFFFFF